jgi:Flp pilus assembly protein TadG
MSINTYFKRIRALGAEKRGAALVEFAVAMFPLFALFFVQLQVASMFAAHLILHHATVVAARCAVIQKGPNQPGNYNTLNNNNATDDNGDADKNCGQAAIDATGIGFWHNTLWNIKAKTEYTAGCNDHTTGGGGAAQYGDVTTTVTADYMCNVPIGAQAICGSMGGTKSLKVIIKEPHEGACYTIDSNKNGS